MRLRTSCSVCHAWKKKCQPTGPNGPCVLCTTKRLVCDLDSKRLLTAQDWNVMESTSSVPARPVLDSIVFEDEALAAELVDIYFDVIHKKQPVMFHRLTFMASYRAGRMPRYLVLAMMSLAARFSSSPRLVACPILGRARPFFESGLREFNLRTDLISTYALQAACLLRDCSYAEGLKDQEALLGAQATRIAQMMAQRPEFYTDPVEREVNISLYWVTWTNDLWYSCEHRVPRGLNPLSQYPTPLDDLTDIDPTANENSKRETSLRALMLSLLDLYPDVQSLNYRKDGSVTRAEEFRGLQNRMEDLLRSLPQHLRDDLLNPENFSYPDRASDITIPHLLYHTLNQMLYFQFLSRRQSGSIGFSAEQITDFITCCKHHAAAVTKMMYLWFERNPSDMTLFCASCNGQMLAVGTAVHLNSLIFDADEQSISDAKQYLEQNYIMMLRLGEYWPSLKKTVAQVQAIHEACRVNGTPLTFDITSWMADFLHRN